MAMRLERVETLAVSKSKDVPVGYRRFILCNTGETPVYFRPADGKKTTASNGFPLYPQQKTDVITAEVLSVAADDKGELRILFVREE